MEYQINYTRKEWKTALERYHFNEQDVERVIAILDAFNDNFGVKMWYETRDGEMYGKKSDSSQRIEKIAIVILTIGEQFDRICEQYEEDGELLLAYAADCLGMEVLRKAYEEVGKVIYSNEKLYPGYFHFLEGEELKQLPDILGRLQITEVRCNEQYVMIPQKSVAFFTELSRKEQKNCLTLCEQCANKTCENRCEEREKNI